MATEPRTMRDLLKDTEREIQDEQATRCRAKLKERLRELEAAEQVVAKLKEQLDKLLDKPVAEVAGG